MIIERALRRLPQAANDDGEFALAARLWDGDVILATPDHAVRLVIVGGKITEASKASKDATALIRMTGPADGWTKMLQAKPEPFYQDIFGAQLHHGFWIQGAIQDVGPYYPALRRLIELLRQD
jgi:hypothetical protein